MVREKSGKNRFFFKVGEKSGNGVSSQGNTKIRSDEGLTLETSFSF